MQERAGGHSDIEGWRVIGEGKKGGEEGLKGCLVKRRLVLFREFAGGI